MAIVKANLNGNDLQLSGGNFNSTDSCICEFDVVADSWYATTLKGGQASDTVTVYGANITSDTITQFITEHNKHNFIVQVIFDEGTVALNMNIKAGLASYCKFNKTTKTVTIYATNKNVLNDVMSCTGSVVITAVSAENVYAESDGYTNAINTDNFLKAENKTSQLTFASGVVKTDYGTYLYKVGNMVFASINLTVNAKSSSLITLGQLSEPLIPFYSPVTNIVTNKGENAYFYINGKNYSSTSRTVGEIGIRKMNESSTWASDDGVRICLSYCLS